MFVCELKCLNQTQGLLNRASNWEVVDGDLSQDTLVINDEQTPRIQEIYMNLMDFRINKCYIRFNQTGSIQISQR